MQILTSIGLIILIATVWGIISFGLFMLGFHLFSDPDFKDEDDREIYEHNYWKNKKKKR